MLTLVTKNGGELRSDVFAALLKHHLSDGVLFGCECSVVSGAIRVSSGALIACGHIVTIDSEDLAATSGDELVIKINLSDGSASFILRDSTEHIQEDLFAGGSTYEVQLATYTLLGSTTSSVTRTLGKPSEGRTITTGSAEPVNPSKGDIWFVTE